MVVGWGGDDSGSKLEGIQGRMAAGPVLGLGAVSVLFMVSTFQQAPAVMVLVSLSRAR